MHKTFNTNFFLIISIVLCVFTGCKSQKTITSKKNNPYERAPIVEVLEDQLKLDAILIDATTQMELGNSAKAMELYKDILAKDSNYAAAHYGLANLYFLARDVNSAIQESKKAISINPKNIWYQLQLAGIYQQVSKYAEAAKVFEYIVEQNPEELEYYDEWAKSLLLANKAEDAVKVYDLIEKRVGISEDISTQKQGIWSAIGETNKATAEIEKLSKAFPNEVKYNAILAEIYMSAKNYSKALAYYNKIKNANPSDKYIDISLANYYQKTKEPKKAYEYLKLGLQNPNLNEDSKAQILLSFYSIKEFYGEYKEYAFDLTSTFIKTYPNNSLILPIYGDFLFKDKKFDEALHVFRKITTQDSSRYEIWEAVLFTELELRKDSLLLTDAKRASELFPMQPIPAYFYGSALINKKEYKNALSVLNTGVKWVVDNNNLLAEFYSSIGECYYRLNEYDKSDDFMRKSLKLNPENYFLLNNFAYYLSERRINLDEAEAMSKKTIEKFPEDATFLDTYAWILYEKGQYKESLIYMEKALKYDTDASAVVLEHYADVLYKLGQTEKAHEYWKKADAKGEGSVYLKEKAKAGILKTH